MGFGIVALVVATGYAVGRIGILGENALEVLTKAAFFVFTPALLFVVLGDADINQLFSNLLPVSALAAGGTLVLFVVLAKVFWKRNVSQLTVGVWPRLM